MRNRDHRDVLFDSVVGRLVEGLAVFVFGQGSALL